MANDKGCGCYVVQPLKDVFALANDECRYPALNALVQQLVDEFVGTLEAWHAEQCCGHKGQSCFEFTVKHFFYNNPALATAAKLGYKPKGEDSNEHTF